MLTSFSFVIILMNIWTRYKLPLMSNLSSHLNLIQFRIQNDRPNIFHLQKFHRLFQMQSWIGNQTWIFSVFLTLENIFSFLQIEEVTRVMDRTMGFLQNQSKSFKNDCETHLLRHKSSHQTAVKQISKNGFKVIHGRNGKNNKD